MTSIGKHAFDCENLTTVVSLIENPYKIGNDVFSQNTTKNATLYVPVGSSEKYKAVDGWKNFVLISEIEYIPDPKPEAVTVTVKNCSRVYGEANPTFEYGTTGADVADDITFKVNVVERHTVILDELATVVPTAVQNVDVTVKRTIKANEWSTICLPFAMTAEQVKTAFGDDVKLNDFEGIETDYEGKNIVGIQVKFNTATAIEENHPYLIKVSSLINEFSVNNVSINPVTKPTVDKDELYFKGVYFYNSFVGTYVAETIVPKNNLFLSNNKFWYSTGSTQMKAFRGYFDFMDILSDVENASTRIGFNFDETTGIKEVHGNANVEGTYDLQGRKVEEPTNKGLYIVNGHKVVIK